MPNLVQRLGVSSSYSGNADWNAGQRELASAGYGHSTEPVSDTS
jgi:hypothetical protein